MASVFVLKFDFGCDDSISLPYGDYRASHRLPVSGTNPMDTPFPIRIARSKRVSWEHTTAYAFSVGTHSR